MFPSPRLLTSFLATVPFFAGSAVSGDAPAGNLVAQGVVSLSEEAALLFASFRDCRFPGAGDAAGVILLSIDDGSSWRQVSEPIAHAEFEYVTLLGEGDFRIFGELSGEGPAFDPFVWVPGTGESSWELYKIYRGAAQLESVAAFDEKHLLAWIRHLELGDDGWQGDVFVHRSDDGGRSWRQLDNAPSFSRDRNELHLRKIRRVASGWRAVDDEAGGFEIQRELAAAGGWRTVATFPWQPCELSEEVDPYDLKDADRKSAAGLGMR